MNVTAGFCEYNLKEIVQEFRDSASPTELEYVLPETVGETKNTRIQPSLLRALPPGVGVYLKPFKNVLGSRIIFAGPSKAFTQANRDQQRELNHAVYSLYGSGILVDSIVYMNKRDARFDYT